MDNQLRFFGGGEKNFLAKYRHHVRRVGVVKPDELREALDRCLRGLQVSVEIGAELIQQYLVLGIVQLAGFDAEVINMAIRRAEDDSDS